MADKSVCPKCKKKIEVENARFCTGCGYQFKDGSRSAGGKNHKPLYICIIVLIMILIALAALIVIKYQAGELSIPFLLNNQTTETIDLSAEDADDESTDAEDDEEEQIDADSEKAEEDAAAEAAPAAEDVAVEAPAEEEAPIEPWDIDIYGEISYIESWCSEVDNNLEWYDYYDFGGVSCYVQEAGPVKVMVKKDYNGWNYNREYYGNGIFFVRVYNLSEEHRFYFSESRLFRYVDENGVIHDYGSENWADYVALSEKVCEEQSTLYTELREKVAHAR